ncbi:MAG: hypothetical protein N3E50_02710 [Candidatus Goldbacteria bacterium]|nr:hypothetical protein [Candidatus Goldiibacteriota bacterium]
MHIKKIKYFNDRILLFIILFLSIHFCIKCVSVAITQPFSFDGAIIAQVAQNMAEKLQFKRNYFDDKFYNPVIGFTVIFPVALFFKLFGQTFSSGLFINAIYMTLLFFFVIYYLKYCLKLDNFFIFIFIIVFYSTREIFNYGFGLYGEIPMVFYFIFSLILLHKYEIKNDKNTIFWFGIVLGLGFMTKFVFLIVIPGLFFVIFWRLILIKKVNIKKFILHHLILFFGFLLPNFLFELYKLISVGIKDFFIMWYWLLLGAGEQSGALKYAGGRIKDSPDFFTKINTHINFLVGYTGIHKIIVIFLLIFGLLLFYLFIYFTLKYLNKKIKPYKNFKSILNSSVLFLIIVMLSYFIWWIFITPTDRAWHRRIIPGIILYEICFVIFLYFIWMILSDYLKKKKKVFNIFTLFILLISIIGAFYILNFHENTKISFKWTAAKSQIMQVGRYMQTFPTDSEFFGFRWWQAPNISFASKKVFKDFFNSDEMKTKGEKINKFLVIDREAMQNQELCIAKILADFTYELVFVNDEARIYKLTERIREREYVEECN